MTDKCSFCGNEEFKHASTQYIYQRNNLLMVVLLMVVDDVPTVICNCCGERYYDIKTLKQIENRFEAIYVHGQPPARQVSISLESWNGLKQAS